MTERVQSLESLASLLGADTALPYRDVVGTASNVLRSHDLHSGNTLMGISWDSSQQNKAITELQASWGDAFYFSGPAGIPTCGSTAFGAFAHHVPDDGNIFIVYGPTISMEGRVVQLTEAGQQVLSTPADHKDPMLYAAAARSVEAGASPDRRPEENALALFTAAQTAMHGIISWDFPGRIVLLGGIFAAHVPYVGSCFVPLEFKLFHPGPDSSEDLLWQLEEAEAVIPAQADPHLPDPVRKTLETSFRGALPTASFVHGLREALEHHAVHLGSSLLVLSSCPDEINRVVSNAIRRHFRQWCWAGGLAGLPFGAGPARAKMDNMPDANVVIVVASHVGVDEDGTIGKITRPHMSHASTSCGSAVGAYTALLANPRAAEDIDPVGDPQQRHVAALLSEHMDSIKAAESPMRQLALQTLAIAADESASMVEHAIRSRSKGGGGNHHQGRVVVVEAVQINTPCNSADYVYARRVTMLAQGEGGVAEDLLAETLAQAPRRGGGVTSRLPRRDSFCT